MATHRFISTTHRFSAKLAIVTFILAFIVILLGAYTRLTDAGLSCPDWPHCYGYLTAPHTHSQLEGAKEQYPAFPVNTSKAWTEMTHRYFAGFEGLLILLLAGLILFTRKIKEHKTTLFGFSLIALLGVQVLLGMLTVTEKLKPIIVLSHLLTGLSLLSLLWWACLILNISPDFFIKKTKSSLTSWLILGALILSLQITLGGWVSTHYAGLACIDFPFCNGQMLPVFAWTHLNSDLISIHMMHRIGALVTAIYLSIMTVVMLRSPALRLLGMFIFGLLILQITLGILNILWLRPVWLALCHHAVAVLLLLSLLTAIIKTSLIGEHKR